MDLDPYLIPYIKINSEWITNLNVRAKNINLLERNMDICLCDFELGNDFLIMTPKS
jgi:hypothetical protein